MNSPTSNTAESEGGSAAAASEDAAAAAAGSPAIKVVQFGGMTRGMTLSPPCAKVHMALHFKGLDFGLVNCVSPGQIKRHNPRGRVPVLLIDGTSVVDSSDILDELDRRYPEPPLSPPSEVERAVCHMIEDWADEVLYFQAVYLRWMTDDGYAALKEKAFATMPWLLRKLIPGVARRKVRQRLAGQGTGLKPESVVRAEFEQGLAMLAAMLDPGPFLVGKELTRADLAVASVLDQLCVEAITPTVAAQIRGNEVLRSWLERVHERIPQVAG